MRRWLLLGLGCLLLAPLLVLAQTQLFDSNVVIVGHENHCVASTGTATYACNLDRLPTTPAYLAGTCYQFTAVNANIGPATINFSSLGAIPITKVVGGITTALVDNDIRAGHIVKVCYDGTRMQCQNCTGNLQPVGDCTLGSLSILGGAKALTNNSAITIASATLATGSLHASQYRYGVEVTNGTDYQIEEGIVSCHATNKAGTIANNTCTAKVANQQAMTSGTLTITFAITAANPAVISVNANSSLTSITAGYPRITFEALNLTRQNMILP